MRRASSRVSDLRRRSTYPADAIEKNPGQSTRPRSAEFSRLGFCVEYSWAEGNFDRLPASAADLIHNKVDVIAAMSGDVSIRATIRASSTIPVVFITGSNSEPRETAAVPSVAREPRALSPALAAPVPTAAPPRASSPVMVPATSETKEIQTVMVAPDGPGGNK